VSRQCVAGSGALVLPCTAGVVSSKPCTFTCSLVCSSWPRVACWLAVVGRVGSAAPGWGAAGRHSVLPGTTERSRHAAAPWRAAAGWPPSRPAVPNAGLTPSGVRRVHGCSHLASSEGCYQVTEWLISQGCNINALDRFNRTPLEVRESGGGGGGVWGGAGRKAGHAADGAPVPGLALFWLASAVGPAACAL
jgi:hypothetical protein